MTRYQGLASLVKHESLEERVAMRDFQTVGPHTLKHGNEVVSAGEAKCSS